MPELKTPLLNREELKYNIQNAYQDGDGEASKQFHEINQLEVESYHKKYGGELLKSLIFGGLDGIVTTFAIICSSHATGLNYNKILIIGLANVLADAISMGHGDYFSEQAEYEYITDQYNREKWEMKNYPQGEKQEMITLYTKKHGIEEEDAKTIINTMAKYEDFFVDHMMVIELDLMPPDETSGAVKNGLVTFFSFLFFGTIPLLFYVYLRSLIIASLSSIGLLGMMGIIKANFTNSNKIYSCMITIINGCFSAGLAFLVGKGLSSIIVN